MPFPAGLSSFYSELMKGIGASGRLWQLIDRTPTIPLSGELTSDLLPVLKGLCHCSFIYYFLSSWTNYIET